jgi:acetyl-CoA carboxylase biotin carboxylase subunit
MPSPGQITDWHVPSGPGVRIDTGFERGYVIQPFYDSLVAKLMVWGRDRPQALARARRALGEFSVEGIDTTAGLHRELLEWGLLQEGRVDTEALERHLSETLAAG